MFSWLGSLAQSCCEEGGALQTNITGVCWEHSQCSGHSGFAPLVACVLSPTTLLRLQAALQGAGPEVRALPRPKPLRFHFPGPPQRGSLGPAFCAFPGASSSGSQELEERTLPGCGAPSPLRGPSFSFRLSGAPCVTSGELVSSRNPPGRCQPSRISGSLWLETGYLFAV